MALMCGGGGGEIELSPEEKQANQFLNDLSNNITKREKKVRASSCSAPREQHASVVALSGRGIAMAVGYLRSPLARMRTKAVAAVIRGGGSVSQPTKCDTNTCAVWSGAKRARQGTLHCSFAMPGRRGMRWASSPLPTPHFLVAATPWMQTTQTIVLARMPCTGH
jgi:hypothetical protein